MGKLAARMADPSRSGVYRVETLEAVEEAAALNGYRLLRASGEALPAELPQVVALFAKPDAATLAALSAHAGRARERGECFFAVCVDPERAAAALPPLYNWGRLRPPGESG